MALFRNRIPSEKKPSEISRARERVESASPSKLLALVLSSSFSSRCFRSVLFSSLSLSPTVFGLTFLSYPAFCSGKLQMGDQSYLMGMGQSTGGKKAGPALATEIISGTFSGWQRGRGREGSSFPIPTLVSSRPLEKYIPVRTIALIISCAEGNLIDRSPTDSPTLLRVSGARDKTLRHPATVVSTQRWVIFPRASRYSPCLQVDDILTGKMRSTIN